LKSGISLLESWAIPSSSRLHVSLISPNTRNNTNKGTETVPKGEKEKGIAKRGCKTMPRGEKGRGIGIAILQFRG